MAGAGDVVRAWADALDRGDLEGSHEFVAPDVEWANPVASVRGAAELRALLDAFWTAIPDFQHSLTAVLEEGALVAVEGVAHGTHTGPLVGPMGEIPATGKRVEFPFAAWARVEDGKIRRFRGYWDLAGFMAQLGLAPEPAAAHA
ncbi:MAG TPA: ester cyclase [Gaiella sp.]